MQTKVVLDCFASLPGVLVAIALMIVSVINVFISSDNQDGWDCILLALPAFSESHTCTSPPMRVVLNRWPCYIFLKCDKSAVEMVLLFCLIRGDKGSTSDMLLGHVATGLLLAAHAQAVGPHTQEAWEALALRGGYSVCAPTAARCTCWLHLDQADDLELIRH
jgi:hypothetical protein